MQTKDEILSHTIHVGFSAPDLRHIKHCANSFGMTLASYVRMLCMRNARPLQEPRHEPITLSDPNDLDKAPQLPPVEHQA